MRGLAQVLALALRLLGRISLAIELNVDDNGTQPRPVMLLALTNIHPAGSMKKAASTAAYGLVRYYTGNNTGDTPGNLPDPYYCQCLPGGPRWKRTG